MAVLTQLPDEATISAFKGKIDFYLWKGIPVARKFPVYRKREPYPAERANQEKFAYINRMASTLPEFEIANLKRMVAGTGWTWKDLLVSLYMKGLPT